MLGLVRTHDPQGSSLYIAGDSYIDPLYLKNRFVSCKKPVPASVLATSYFGRNARRYLASHGNPTEQRAVHYACGPIGGIKVRARALTMRAASGAQLRRPSKKMCHGKRGILLIP